MTGPSPLRPATPAPGDPFFETIPDGLWNACVGVQGSDENYVDGYLEAARLLVATVIDQKMMGSRDTLALPMLYNCRHGLELALKLVIDRLYGVGMIVERHRPNHDIQSHWEHLRDAGIGDARLLDLIGKLEPYVRSLASIDGDGQELRYAVNREGERSLGGLAVVHLPLIRHSIDALSALLNSIKLRVIDLEDERLTGTHTGECSREDLKQIAHIVGHHSTWADTDFTDRKAAVMARYGLGSRKFSQALAAIRTSRPLGVLVGLETPLRHLEDDQVMKVLELWSEAYPERTVDRAALGTPFVKLTPDALERHSRKTRTLVESVINLMSLEAFADLETAYYLGRNREPGEHYDVNLDRTLKKHAVSASRLADVNHIMTKTNLLDGVVAGVAEAGRPSLAERLRRIRPV